MADDVVIPATGTGTVQPTVATDEVSSRHHQLVKVEFGVADTATMVSSSNPLPVVQTGTPGLPTGASTETTLAAVNSKLGATLTVGLPSGAATDATLATGNVNTTAIATGVGTPTDAAATTTGSVVAQLRRIANLLAATLTINLPSGASTAAKQPGIGTAGSANADVLSVQGIASGTPLNVAGSFSASGTTDLTATGNLTASGQTVAITTLNGMATAEFDLSGTYTHSILSEGTIDGTNWFGITTPYSPATGGSTPDVNGNQFLGNGRYQVNVAGYAGVRARCSLTGTGTAVIAIRASAAPGVNQNLATIGNTAVDTNSGNKSSGTQRVVLATDQPSLANPLSVTLGTLGHGTAAAAARVELPTDGTGVVGLNAGANLIGKVGIDQTTPGTTNLVALAANQTVNQAQVAGTAVDTNSGNKSAGTQRMVLATDQPNLTTPLNVAMAANQSVNNSQVSGTAISVNNGTVDAGTTRVTLASNSTGQVALAAGSAAVGSVTTELATGLTPYSNTALSSTKQQVKGSSGKLYGWMISNPNATAVFVQVWDVALASITVGTTAPTYTLKIPGGSAGAAANTFTDRGITHSTAICVAVTTTSTGSTAPGSACDVSLFYI